VANTVLLNNLDHAALRVATRRSAAFGDDVMYALTFPDEFRSVQAHYPIVFRKAADGSFLPLALFGLREGENLFLGPDGWDAGYVPLSIERQPFLIGQSGGEWVVHVDLDHPRIGREDGEPVFRPHGGTTEFLERISSVLSALHEGVQRTPAFVAALLEHGLLESFVFDCALPDGAQHRLGGFYTIHEERLARLDAAALDRLHRAGHLQPIYMAVASLSQLRTLVDRLQHRQDAHA
jgi:hypothetical protein